MSTFAVTVEQITVSAHPNADRLEIASVGDYQCIVGKGQYKNGDLVAYIPEQAVLPLSLLREMNLEGRLAGKDKNRVKAIKLRNVLSQGLVYPARDGWVLGQDVTKELGIIKWEPPVPAHLAGEVFSLGQEYTLKYDIENYKRFPSIFQSEEFVVFTEKLHGSWACIGLLPERMAHAQQGRIVVTSKGLSARGLAMKYDAPANKNNLYVRVARHYNMDARISTAFPEYVNDVENPVPVYVLGEVFGGGVQDLTYGAKADKDVDIGFRIFDIFVGLPASGRFLNDDELEAACEKLGLPRVPVLYRGPFSREKLYQYTDGYETVTGKSLHIREGIVVRPVVERYDDEIGRVQLKSVSGDYLTRKGKTTEYQ